MMVMKAMYRRTLMKPGIQISNTINRFCKNKNCCQFILSSKRTVQHKTAGEKKHSYSIYIVCTVYIQHTKYITCQELSIEHVDSFVVPGILTLQVNSVKKVFNKGCQHHGQKDGILEDKRKQKHFEVILFSM